MYYAADSYAGFWVRLLAWLIDLLVLSVFLGSYGLVYAKFSEQTLGETNILFLISLITSHFYLAIIKRTKGSTLGFKLTKIKVVNLYGDRPSVVAMTVRFLLLAVGPFSLFPDLIWLAGERTKQTLRDKFMGTYVVRKSANPIGEAEIVQTRLLLLGWNLIYREVKIPEQGA